MKILIALAFLLVYALASFGFNSLVEVDLRRGATGTIRFDPQNQKYEACVGSDCAEVWF